MIKTIIEKMCNLDEEMKIVSKVMDTYRHIPKNINKNSKKYILNQFFMNRVDTEFDVCIQIEEENARKTCLIKINKNEIVLYDEPMAKKIIYGGAEVMLPPNVKVESFENIFGNIEGENIKRIYDINFSSEMMQSIENIKRAKKMDLIIDKISNSDQICIVRIKGINKNKKIQFTLNETDAAEERKEEFIKQLNQYFKEKDFEDGALFDIIAFANDTPKICGLIVNSEHILLLSKKIIERAMKQNDTDDAEEYMEDAIPESFEKLFGKFNNDKNVIRLEEDENGEWIEV